MKRIIPILLIICVIFAILVGCAPVEEVYDQDLVRNGDFEESFSNWTKRNGQGAIFDIVTTNIGSDQYVENFGEKQLELNSGFYYSWLMLTQDITVVKGGTYKLQVNINVSDAIDNETTSAARIGAYVGFEQDLGIKRINILTATDGWQTYVIYFTPVNDTKLTLQVGVGTNVSPAKGKARFDNISVVRVESVMGGNEIYNVGSTGALDRSNTEGKVYVILLAIITPLIMYLAYVLVRRTMAKYPSSKIGDESYYVDGKFDYKGFLKSPAIMMTIVLVLAFAVRLIIVNYIYGHNNDISIFSNWAKRLADNGPWNFYKNVDTVYPPGYLYILWALGGAAKGLNIASGTLGMAIFLKIPSIVSDIIIVYLIFYLGSKHFNYYISAVFAGVYALLPVIFTNSAAWGQMDSVYILFVLLTFIAILDKKLIPIIAYFSIAVFIKAEALIFLPIIASYLIFVYVKQPETRQKLLIATGTAIIGFFLLALPFTVLLGGANVVFYSIGRLVASALANPVFSSNAFNFYGIFGFNLEPVTTFARVLSFLIYSIIAFYVCFIYFYKRNRAELLLLSSFLISAVYVFSTAMTSQSMLAAFALMLAYIAISGEKRVLFIFTILSVTNFLNIAQLLNQSGFIGLGANAQLISYADNSLFMIIGGIVNVLTIVYFAVVTYDICYTDDVRELEPMNNNYFKTVGDFFKGVVSIFSGGKKK